MIFALAFFGAVLAGFLIGWAIRPAEHHHHVTVRHIEMLAIDPPLDVDDETHDATFERVELARIRQLRNDWILP